ncbi:MAG: CPBP family intramembrane glutamic endopeptidase [Candidatus Promineifilaceae bacterium]|nr:CPBP family intramembrane glutamic endopeptidase [Candidatus Promineifilaceae bacterium]
MKTIYRIIERYPVLIFYILAFAISWGTLLWVMDPENFVGAKVTAESKMPLLFLAILSGPTVAGLMLTGILHGREGVRRLLSQLLKWRVGARWYAAALLTAPLVMAGTLFLLSRFSPAFQPSIVTADGRVAFLIAGIMGGLAAGIFEELGWTGFALSELRQRYRVIPTGLIIGVLWGAWHFPLFSASGHFAEAIPPFLYILVLLFSFLPPYRVLMVWVYDHTDSLLLAVLMHMSLTAGTLILQPTVTGSQAMIYNLALAGVLWLIAIGITVTNRLQASRQHISKRAA